MVLICYFCWVFFFCLRVCGVVFNNFFSRLERLLHISFQNIMPLQDISNNRIRIPGFSKSIVLNSCLDRERLSSSYDAKMMG